MMNTGQHFRTFHKRVCDNPQNSVLYVAGKILPQGIVCEKCMKIWLPLL